MHIKRWLYFSLTCLLIIWVQTEVKAQCVDSLRIYPTAPCDPTYQPICACGVTYRNLCYANYRSGLIAAYTDGPCSGFEFDIFPTFVSSDVDNIVTITFAENTGKTASFYVLDAYGKVAMQRILPAADQFIKPYYNFEIDVSEYRVGTYIVMAYNSQGTYRYKKFVRF